MSRIHDALKRAAEERASADAAGIATEFIDVQGDLPRKVVPREAPPANLPSGIDKSRNHTFLNYDDLRQHCTHPIWKPDPRLNAFDDQGGRKAEPSVFELCVRDCIRLLLLAS